MPVKRADSQLDLEVLNTVVAHMHWHEEERAVIQLLMPPVSLRDQDLPHVHNICVYDYTL